MCNPSIYHFLVDILVVSRHSSIEAGIGRSSVGVIAIAVVAMPRSSVRTPLAICVFVFQPTDRQQRRGRREAGRRGRREPRPTSPNGHKAPIQSNLTASGLRPPTPFRPSRADGGGHSVSVGLGVASLIHRSLAAATAATAAAAAAAAEEEEEDESLSDCSIPLSSLSLSLPRAWRGVGVSSSSSRHHAALSRSSVTTRAPSPNGAAECGHGGGR